MLSSTCCNRKKTEMLYRLRINITDNQVIAESTLQDIEVPRRSSP